MVHARGQVVKDLANQGGPQNVVLTGYMKCDGKSFPEAEVDFNGHLYWLRLDQLFAVSSDYSLPRFNPKAPYQPKGAIDARPVLEFDLVAKAD